MTKLVDDKKGSPFLNRFISNKLKVINVCIAPEMKHCRGRYLSGGKMLYVIKIAIKLDVAKEQKLIVNETMMDTNDNLGFEFL